MRTYTGHLVRLAVVLLTCVAMAYDTGAIVPRGACAAAPVAGRKVISLDGTWQFATGTVDQSPDTFPRTIAVPGVVDMAVPALPNVGQNTQFADDGGHKFNLIPDRHYRAFWYRRTFTLDGDVPPVAMLRFAKTKFGTHVWVNGTDLGTHWKCFTPTYFDVARVLKGNGQQNELLVCLGPDPTVIGDRAANGYDFEKHSYLAGIYDSVTLTLTGAPYIVNVQVVPEIEQGTARVFAEVRNVTEQPIQTAVTFEVHPYQKTSVVGSTRVAALHIAAGKARRIEVPIRIQDCKLWSPEAPNLYDLVTRTDVDTLTTRFGMRAFRFDDASSIGILNGKPYYLRGSNVCYFRFEEDPGRGGKPWNEQWVRTLHRRFKSLHMNALRYCIGFPPEMWYRIADEEGIIIQDEFPIWTLGEDDMTPVSAGKLASEYQDWMRAHWNYASVLIWDAQNECRFDKTRQAIGRVRQLDLSHRPWDNGWGKPQRPDDMMEDHPYQYSRSMGVMSWNPKLKPLPPLAEVVARYKQMGPNGSRPRIVNEYAWLWLRRDGAPTTLTRDGYATYLPGADAQARRLFYARHLSAMTEALRASRRVAGVLYFCGLGHSWDGCATSDNFVDIDALRFEPNFLEYMQYAFAPVGVMLELPDTCQPGQQLQARLTVVNDLESPWRGKITLTWPDHEPMSTDVVAVPGYGRAEQVIALAAPATAGEFEFCARITGAEKQPVLSRRLVVVEPKP